MDRRSFLKNTGWSFLGLAASGSLLGACAAGSKDAKKIMPSVMVICAMLLKQQKNNWTLYQ